MAAPARTILSQGDSLELSPDDLAYFCAVIEERAGIALKPAKHELVRTRLRSRVGACGFKTFQEYRAHLQRLSRDDPEWESFTNLLTTNKTDFFREPKHFEYLVNTILPQWLKTGAPVFRVWSAASSTGEEAYTLAMVLSRHIPAGKDFRIFASDIDTQVVRTAQNAVYPISKKSEIPDAYHTPCLDFGKRDARGWFRIKPELKEKVTFKTYNLIGKAAPSEEAFDLVLCRNVLIYFNQEKIDLVQRKLFGSVRKGGHLFIGHSESLQGISHQWKAVGPSIFRKEG